jgi:amidase
VNRVADALVDGGARVGRHSPLLPDLTEAARASYRPAVSRATGPTPTRDLVQPADPRR